jgi:hypothetical protein
MSYAKELETQIRFLSRGPGQQTEEKNSTGVNVVDAARGENVSRICAFC